MSDNEYEPYGPEWKKEMMKFTKEELISMMRIALIRVHGINETLKIKIAEFEKHQAGTMH